ncbi:MAG: choice-of-anchor D domain-containing protein, partial [Actinomycetota bacterium]|nr:choice-of-anchor D domain-containing protein [Actinomycetota bacterium]
GGQSPLDLLHGTADALLESIEGRNVRLLALQDLLENHKDPLGNVRPDLWLDGVSNSLDAPVSAAMVGAPGSGVQGAQWTQIGPAPIRYDADQVFMGVGPGAGEVLDIAIDPRNTTDRIIYVATNNGGIWKSIDGGASWAPKSDYLPSLSMGAVALDPGNPSIVYAGSGNNYDGANGRLSSTGFALAAGVYRSVDAGNTWTVLDPGNIFSGPQNGVNRIALPAPGILLVATNGGLFRSVDGGISFGNNAPAFDDGNPIVNGNITDVDLDTADPTRVYASVVGTGILVSTDSGATFPAAGNLFTATNGAPATVPGYIAMAQSLNPNNNTMFATVGAPWTGLYRSQDDGANWTRMGGADAPAADNNGCQCGYDQTVGVDPQDPNRVYIGFQELYRSTDGGATFGMPAVSRNLTHWDHHAITFSPQAHWGGAAPTRMYTGTDGGLHRSNDGGTTWTDLNEGVATALLKQIDIGRGSATANEFTYGGTQDNGTLQTRPGYTGTEWHLGMNGDGNPVAVDPTDPNHVYAHRNGNMRVTTDGGTTWAPTASQPTTGAFRIALDPSNVNTVWAGAAVPGSFGMRSQADFWRSTDATATFTQITTFTQNIRTIATSKLDSNVLWVGLAGGRLARSTNATAATPTFTEVQLPGTTARVDGVAIDPTNTDVVVATVGGFSATAAGQRTRHVFLTTDAGANWTDISGTDGQAVTNLPDLPTHSVVIDPGTSPHSIIVSNDASVWRSSDLGATWFKLGLGLPNVDARKLAMDEEANPPVLRVGTYGRSAFELTPANGPLLAVNGDLAFGNVAVGKFKDKVVQVFNVGSSDLHVNSFHRSSGSNEFAKSSGPATPVTIPPGGHVDFTVRFSPVTPGDRTATFQINSDDPFEPTKTLDATGRGVTGIAQVSGDLDFGTVARGTTGQREVTIQNGGEGPLEVTGVSFTGGSDSAYSVAPNPGTPQTVQPGGSVIYTIRFSPPVGSGPGTRTGTLRVTTDDPADPVVDLAATGVVGVPKAVIGSTSLGFGGVPVDNRTAPNSKDLTVTVANEASCPQCDLIVSGLSIAGTEASNFTLVDPPSLPASVGAGNSLTLTVRFNPDDEGDRAATLTINTDDPVNPNHAVALAGRGLLPAIDALPASLTFPPTVIDPQCATRCGTTGTTVVRNVGEAELIIDHTGVTGSPAYSTAPASVPPERLAASDGTIKSVVFRPTVAARKLTGTLLVRDDLPQDLPVVQREIPLCGEAVGRGIRLLVVDRNGIPYSNVTMMKLQGFGIVKHVGINQRNLSLTTISPPDVCETIKFQYENQNLPAAEGQNSPGSFYRLTAKVGNTQTVIDFELAVNEFKELVVTVG